MENNLSLNQKKVLALFDEKNRVSIHDVVENLKIPRPTAKQILTRLTKIGLLQQKGLSRGSYYTLMKESEILDPKGDQLVLVYKGMDSFKRLFDQTAKKLKKGDFYWSFAFSDEYYDKNISSMLADFHKKISDKGVDDKTIVNIKKQSLVSNNFKNAKKLKIRYTNINVPTGMIILSNSAINLVWGKQPLAVVIKAPEIYKRYQEFFKSIWKISSK
jgi:predicted transcriptional regulator